MGLVELGKSLASTVVAITICCASFEGPKAQALDGAELITVDDGHARVCIDGTTQRLSIILARLVSEKKVSWLTEQNSVDILINRGIEYRTGDKVDKVSVPYSIKSQLAAL